jgi:ZIP family zinc transporter
MALTVILCLLIPFVGTTLGAAMVFFLKKEMNEKLQKALLGFAAGVMIAASIWSLIQPAIETYNDYRKWLVPTIGFILGVGFLLLIDYLVPHMHVNNNEEGIKNTSLSKTFKMMLAVTIHNIPEGLAVGVIIGSFITGNVNKEAMLALSIGIAIQNFPEGAIISMPLKEEDNSKSKSFLYGTLSGIVEPIFGGITIILTSLVVTILPYLLSFAAGAMIYVVVEELIPESQVGKHSNLGTLGFAFGFIIMMILDVALG